LHDYASLLEAHIRRALGERKLRNLTPLDFQAIYYDLDQKKLSTRTVGYTHAVIYAALEQAVQRRLISKYPATELRFPNLRKPRCRL
jgi:hypothetical protein